MWVWDPGFRPYAGEICCEVTLSVGFGLHCYRLPRVPLNTGLKATPHDSTYRSDLPAEANLFLQLSDPKEAGMSPVGGWL